MKLRLKQQTHDGFETKYIQTNLILKQKKRVRRVCRFGSKVIQPYIGVLALGDLTISQSLNLE